MLLRTLGHDQENKTAPYEAEEVEITTKNPCND